MNKLCTAFVLSILPCLVFAQQLANTPKEINKNQETQATEIAFSEDSSNDLMMFPNPVKHQKFVTITSSKLLQKDVLVYNIMGKEILKQQLINNRLDVTSLNTGIYIMKVVQDGKSVARKLVIR